MTNARLPDALRLSGLRVARESVGLISVAHQAFVTIAGCGVNALSGLRVAREL
ncbi:hypothetical protein [Escherichia coli]|uniref:hypothetical protein n=1 Tax=Escherichia coli TaxID=562 RepID=UPI000A605D87